jgi:hypothetical protein
MILEQRMPLVLKKASPNKLKPNKLSWTILIVDDGISGLQLITFDLQDFEFIQDAIAFLSGYSSRRIGSLTGASRYNPDFIGCGHGI